MRGLWPSDTRFTPRPLKRCCILNPDVLPEDSRADREIDYIDIGNVSLSDGITGTERYRFADAPSRARRVLREGDVLVSTVRTYLRAIARVDEARDGAIASTGFAVLRANRSVEPGFLYRVVQSEPFIQSVVQASTGISYPAINPSTLGDLPIPFPDLAAQKAIAAFLEAETARIDALIEKKKCFVGAASTRIESLVAQAITDGSCPRIRLEYATNRVQRPVNLSEHGELVRLGIYNRGRGGFKKPAADEEAMGVSDFFFVQAGDLIVSGQFAWEGAIAMATEDEAGCVVSHRYPVYRAKSGISTAYVFGLLRSSFGDFLLNEASRGSAGRNRPLNTWRLGKEKIPIPAQMLQAQVEKAVEMERRLKAQIKKSIGLLSEFRAALITAAVTGQIDPADWHRRGESDRRLDRIESEMSA